MSLQALIPADPSGPLKFLLASGVAFAAAAPIGPISILTIQRAVALGFWRSFLPTVGAMTGNGVFGVLAGLGSGYVTASVLGNGIWLRLAGSALLVAMGLRLCSGWGTSRKGAARDFGPIQLALLNFALVLSNPLTLGFYIAAFALLGLTSGRLLAGQSLFLGGGIAFGALVWFAMVCAAASRFHLRAAEALLLRFRMGVGVLFLLLGFVSAVRVLSGN